MKLIKVRDNKNRPVSGLDLMMSAVFGDKVPREFISREYYQKGEHVYKLTEKGDLLIYECNLSGTYIRCEDPGFTEWSLNSLIEKYYSKITDFKEITNDPILYNVKSIVAPSQSYLEYDGKARFVAKTDNFDLNDYNKPDDVVDVYLRREYSDSYLAPSEYEFDGNELSVELPLSEMALITEHKTKFFPEGLNLNGDMNNLVFYDEIGVMINSEEYPDMLLNIDNRASKYFRVVKETEFTYWYGEDGVIKSYPFNEKGISIKNYDILETLGKPIVLGYKICDLKIDAVHTIVESPINGLQEKDVYRLDEFIIDGKHDPIGSDISDEVQTITIPINVEPTRDLTDELYVTLDPSTQLISLSSKNGYVKQVRFSLVSRKLKPLSAFIIGSKATSDMTRFIQVTNEYGKVVDIDGSKYIKFPRYDLLRYNSFDFELYHDRVFTSDYEEYINDDGELFIKMLDESAINYKTDKFLFHIYYSISQGVAITRTSDTNKVVDDKDAFRIFLTTEFINKFQWLKLRENYKLIPPEVTVGSKTSANISDPNHYLSIGETLRADVFSLIVKNVEENRRDGSMTDSCNSESYPILLDTRNLTVPFVDYDAEKDDFLIFKSGGVLLSSAKWYLNGNSVNMYIHETPLHNGDYVDFRLLDRDENVRIYNKFLTGTSDKQKVMDIETDLSKVAFFLLFTVSGQFISPSKYTMEGSTIVFNENCNQPFTVDNGTRLEAVYGVFKNNYCKTIYTTAQIKATEDNQKEFSIDENLDFNKGSDNILIFREDGMYIGERFYHMSEDDDKIIIDNGSGVPKGSHIDVVVIRNLNNEITVGDWSNMIPEETEEVEENNNIIVCKTAVIEQNTIRFVFSDNAYTILSFTDKDNYTLYTHDNNGYSIETLISKLTDEGVELTKITGADTNYEGIDIKEVIISDDCKDIKLLDENDSFVILRLNDDLTFKLTSYNSNGDVTNEILG